MDEKVDVKPEMEAGQEQPQEEPLTPDSCLRTDYEIAVTMVCAHCGRHVALTPPQVVAAALGGASIACRCPSCKKGNLASPKRRIAPATQVPAGMLQPMGAPQLNRHQRRAAARGKLLGADGKPIRL